MKKLVTTAVAAGMLFTTSTAMHVSAEEYEVQKEDTLWGIADKYDTSVNSLKDINGLDSDVIHPNQKINTEDNTSNSDEVYKVEAGDTLSVIAADYDVKVDDIKEWNDLSDSLINIGQELDIKGVAQDTEEVDDTADEVVENESDSTTESESTDSSEAETESKSESESDASSKSEGETFSVSATAYTAECEGCSGVTSTGIDLNANPDKKVIAVDPDVIPLGSEVHVEGYGNAVAGDVGGAINGNKIDVHVPNEAEANSWGVRTVNVTVLD